MNGGHEEKMESELKNPQLESNARERTSPSRRWRFALSNRWILLKFHPPQGIGSLQLCDVAANSSQLSISTWRSNESSHRSAFALGLTNLMVSESEKLKRFPSQSCLVSLWRLHSPAPSVGTSTLKISGAPMDKEIE